MELSNIEVYEQLRKDVSEESAKMIAEVFPRAADLTTKEDFRALTSAFAALESDFVRLKSDFETRFAQLQLELETRVSAFERRVFRWGLTLALAIWATLVAGLIKVVIKL
jgi:hypothetical protein